MSRSPDVQRRLRRPLTERQRHVLATAERLRDEAGGVWPTVARLGQELELSKDAVRSFLQASLDRGAFGAAIHYPGGVRG